MTENRDLLELDLRPLPTVAANDRASDDALLGQALHDIYSSDDVAVPAVNVWEALEPVAHEEATRRRRNYLAGRLAAAMGPRRMVAAAAAVIVLVGLSLALGRLIPHAGPEIPEITALHSTIVATGTSPEKARLLNGAIVDVRGDVAVDQSTPGSALLQLHSGSVHSQVPKLASNQSYIVMTPHAEVSVHGTRFTVEQSSGGDTLVSVEEGLVAVRPLDGHRPTLFVRPGESVTVKPFSTYFAELEAEVSHAAQTEECNDPQDLVAKYIESAPPSSDVSVAHYLLGICAFKKGDQSAALDQFELAAQTTGSRDRAENALVRAAQIRAARDPKDGAEAWHRYLKRFPDGLHTDLARNFLGESPEDAASP